MLAWQTIQLIRDEVNKALEQHRRVGDIGSGLAAELLIYANDAVLPILTRLQDELRFIFITSSAQVLPASACPAELPWHEALGIAIAITPSVHPKCVRCWHRSVDIGQLPEHPELCVRCAGNISATPELRRFA